MGHLELYNCQQKYFGTRTKIDYQDNGNNYINNISNALPQYCHPLVATAASPTALLLLVVHVLVITRWPSF